MGLQAMIQQLVPEKITVLKIDHIFLNNMKPIEKISQCKNLQWLELKCLDTSKITHTKILAPVLKNCKKLKGLITSHNLLDAFDEV